VSEATFFSVARAVAWRVVRIFVRTPALLLPSILFPLFFLVAFAGALGAIAGSGKNASGDYTAFQYVFALLQAAGYAGAMGGFALAEDFETGFMPRLMTAAPNRTAILLGNVVGIVARVAIVAVVLTGCAFLMGMNVGGSAAQLLGLYGLVLLVTLATTLWSLAIALFVRSFKAAPGMALPVFLSLFLTPVFVPLANLTGWLHTVARYNPLTRVVEAGRGFISGHPTDVASSFIAAGALTAAFVVLAVRGVRSAEKAG
jgi:ABC-2 type transport system permease protein